MLVADLEAVLEKLAPKALAEPGDNCGLLAGDERAPVRRILVALELTEPVLEEALAGGYDTILTHHPLLFSPLRSLVDSRPRERLVRRLIAGQISLIACHTNLDAAPGGLADIAGEALGLRGLAPLQRASTDWCKLVGFVPADAVEEVAAAVFAAGAGVIGDYQECAFAAEGRGWFTPGLGTHPAVGRPAVPERTPETRWEAVVPRARVSAAIAAYVGAHPYEEPAFDIYPVENVLAHAGLGRVGTLAEPLPLAALAARAGEAFGLGAPGWSGDGRRIVNRVGVLPGSGRSLIDQAAAVCEVLITGDLSYHDAERAGEAGLSLITVPHGDFEWWAFRRWSKNLDRELAESEVTVETSREWRSPWEGAAAAETAGADADGPRGRGDASKARLWIDGGSRGNPGPSAIGVVLEDDKGSLLDTVSRAIGVATNNVAEYRALLTGLELAEAAGTREVEVLSDSELLVKQMRGEYRVRNEGLKPLHEEAERRARGFDRFSIRHVNREQNAHADSLVNHALDEAL
ncbi:MAG: Nif3-like dinuclear metal center hexameric protein [bacterium]